MKRAATLILILLVLITGGVVLGAGPILNSDPIRARLTTALERATGRQVRLGHLHLAPGTLATLSPSISIEGAALLNPPGYSRPNLLSARRIEAVLSLPPLLTGRVHVNSVTIDDADALLERDATGRGNWLPTPAPPSTPSTSQSHPRQPPELGPILIQSAHISGLGLPPTELRALTLPPGGGPVGGTILINAVPLTLAGTWTLPSSFALTATGAGLTLALSNQPDGPLALEANTPDLAAASALAGTPLPHLQNATLSAHLLPAPSGPGLLLRGLRLTSTQGDAAGDLAITFKPRPALSGSLIAQQWNLDAWTLPPPATPPQPSATPSSSPAPAPEIPWLIPDRPLPFALLRRADADLHLSLNQAIFQGVTYRSVETHLYLQDGHLRLDPFQTLSPAGPLRAQLTADAIATPPTAALALHGPGLSAAALTGAGILAGALDLDLDLHAAGPTWHALAATLTGHAALSLLDGEIENALLSRLFGPALRAAAIPLDSAGHSRLRCLILRTDAADGQLHVATLALDATRLRLEGDGALDLGQETMDLHLRPIIRLGAAGITVPVHLTGPFRTPHPSADKGVLAPGRFGISIAQLGAQLGGAPAPDLCPTAPR